MISRSAGGYSITFFGIFLILISIWFGLVWLIYGVSLLIIGILILLNKNEDKIEKINYKEVKKNKGGENEE